METHGDTARKEEPHRYTYTSSRSNEALELVTSALWWNGPGFLLQNSEEWLDLMTNYEVKVLMKSLSRTYQ